MVRVRRGWWPGSRILQPENSAVRTRMRLARLLVDNLRALVFNPLPAQPLVYPHRVLMILVTSLELSLLKVSVIDFKTRKAGECLSKFPVTQLPAHDLHRSRKPKPSGSSIQMAGKRPSDPSGWGHLEYPDCYGWAVVSKTRGYYPVVLLWGVGVGRANALLLMGALKQEELGDLAKVTYHTHQWENKLRAGSPCSKPPSSAFKYCVQTTDGEYRLIFSRTSRNKLTI